MRIEITGGGIYGSDGKELEIGRTLDVKDDPKGWAGRYRVIGKAEGKQAAKTDQKGTDFEAMKVEELKDYLAEKNVTLKGDELKADLVKMAQKAEKA